MYNLYTKIADKMKHQTLWLIFATTFISLFAVADSQAVTLTITSDHGSVIVAPEKADYDEGDVVELIPRPDTGYYFTGWAGDAHGKRLVLNLTMDSDKTIIANFDIWQPPIGIPEPEFGIFETYRMYDEPENRNPDFTYHQNSEGGYYTHYIDWTDSNATDSDNPYGSVEIPRKTVPSSLSDYIPAGSVVEVHGGPYEPNDSPYPTYMTYWTADGTQDMPVFIRSADVNNPVLFRDMTSILVGGTYLVIENIEFNNSRLHGHRIIPGADHIVIRNNELYGGEVTKNEVVYVAQGTCWVVYNNYIHNCGNPYQEEENDWVGIQAGDYSSENGRHAEDVWVLDNHIHEIGSDGVQLNSGPARELENLPRRIYIGRNIIYCCGENAVDLKQCADTVFSENTVHTFLGWSDGSDGTAIVVNDDSPHENIWIIFNEVYNSRRGIRAQDSAYIIGNILHDIYHDPNDPYNPNHLANEGGNAIQAWGTSSLSWDFVNNTIYRSDNGISLPDGSGSANFINNIVCDLNEESYHIAIRLSSAADGSTFKNSLLYDLENSVNIAWGQSNFETLDQMQTRTGKGEGCIEANPLFVDAAIKDFQLQSISPAIDVGVESDVYQTFFDLYGIDIRKDIDGRSRPQSSDWDIGAYEYTLSAVTDLAVSGASRNSVTVGWTVPG